MSTLFQQHAEFLRAAAASDRRAEAALEAGREMHEAAYRHHAAACRRAAARICAEMVAADEMADPVLHNAA